MVFTIGVRLLPRAGRCLSLGDSASRCRARIRQQGIRAQQQELTHRPGGGVGFVAVRGCLAEWHAGVPLAVHATLGPAGAGRADPREPER